MKTFICNKFSALLLMTLSMAGTSFAQPHYAKNSHEHHYMPVNGESKKTAYAAPTHNMAAHDMNDDPLITYLNLDQLEWRNAKNNEFAWDAEAWIGYDTNKLWLKTEGEKTADKTEYSEIQLLYSHSISAFWNLQTGLRVNIEPESTQNWLAIGFQGLAPYFISVDSALFLGEGSDMAYRLKLEQEWPLTQKLALLPKIELNFYGQNDLKHGQGSGLSETEIGLRLQYQIKRNIAPYIGVHAFKQHGNTADYTRRENEDTDDAQLVIGLHAFF